MPTSLRRSVHCITPVSVKVTPFRHKGNFHLRHDARELPAGAGRRKSMSRSQFPGPGGLGLRLFPALQAVIKVLIARRSK